MVCRQFFNGRNVGDTRFGIFFFRFLKNDKQDDQPKQIMRVQGEIPEVEKLIINNFFHNPAGFSISEITDRNLKVKQSLDLYTRQVGAVTQE